MNQTLVNKLIRRYRLSKIHCKLFPLAICKLIVTALSTDAGVCRCSSYVYSTDVYWSEFMQQHTAENSSYWATPPYWCETKQRLLDSLQCRIDILRTFKEN